MDPLIAMTLSLALAALLAGSAMHKLAAWTEWRGVVHNYRLLPGALAEIPVWLLPPTELLLAAALCLPGFRATAALPAALLLVAYAIAMTINLRRGRTHIDCGCFGSRLAHGLAPWMVLRNAVLAGGALLLRVPVAARDLSPAEVACAVIAVVTAGFLYPVLAVALQPTPPKFDENFHRSAARGSA